MNKILRKLHNNQAGQALLIVLALMALGGFTMVPLLNYMSDGVKASQVHKAKISELYSADSGIENACWRLLYEPDFVETMTEQNPSVEYSMNINNKDVSIVVTRTAGLAGETLSLEVDYLLPVDHQLELRVVVFDDDHMHLAYDTDGYQAWLEMPVGSGNPTFYLHNNPTPPEGDTDAQANLLMDEDNPTTESFYNYDQNYDSSPGRKIEQSSGGPDGLELKEYQNWLTVPFDEETYFYGTAVVNLYISPDGFNFDNACSFRVYLRDYNPVSETYTEITSADYEIGEGEWVQMWQPTAPEGKYHITASIGNTQLEQLIALGFGYLRVLSFVNAGVG